MKKGIRRPSFIAVLGVCLSLVGFVGIATAQTADWSHVSVACVPDDTTTTPSRYDALSSGLIKFQGTATGDLWFWCNVVSPRDTFGENPTWNAMFVTFKDSNADGFVEVKLIRKRKDNGATATNATFTSSDGVDVREDLVFLDPAFDFATYAYFVRIQLHRDSTIGDPEFHIVSLKASVE
jgi:hypothetical protein